MANLYKVLPIAVDDYLATIEKSNKIIEHSAFSSITEEATKSGRSIIDQITYENFGYYLGFDKI